MNKHKSKASTAFSLIELSIVILIVGIIIAGITQSSRLVRQSKLKSAQSLTQSSPVSSIRSIAVWFETSLDESLPAALDDGANLTQWNDTNPQTQSKLFAMPANASNTNNAGSTAITYKVDGIGGLPSISFSGSAAATANVLAIATNNFATATATGGTIANTPIVTNSDANAANAFTAFIVYKLDSAAATNTAYTVLYNGRGVTGGNGWGYQKSAANARAVLFNSVSTLATSTLPSSQEIATIVYSGNTGSPTTADDVVSLYINGGVSFTNTSGNNGRNSAAASVTQPTLNAYIGGVTGTTAGAVPTAVWKGMISEIIIFDIPLKTQDLKDVANYLSRKYGIQLS